MKATLLSMILATTLAALCMAQRRESTTAPQEYKANVEILAYTADGTFLGPPEVFSFIEYSSKRDLTDQFKQGVAKDIPYGTYVLEAGSTGFSGERRVLKVWKTQVTAIVGLELRQEYPAFPVYSRGRVKGALPPGKSFVKVSGIFSSLMEEATISGDGSFELSMLPAGKYLLMVVNEHGLVASRKVQMPGGTLDIDLTIDRVP